MFLVVMLRGKLRLQCRLCSLDGLKVWMGQDVIFGIGESSMKGGLPLHLLVSILEIVVSLGIFFD